MLLTQVAARSFITVDVKAQNIPAGANTNVELFDIPAGASVGIVKMDIIENFSDASATITAVTAEVGDADDTDGFIIAKSVWGGNSPVKHSQSDGAYATLTDSDTNTTVTPGTLKLYTAAKKFLVRFAKTGAGNATALFKKGRISLTVEIINPKLSV